MHDAHTPERVGTHGVANHRDVCSCMQVDYGVDGHMDGGALYNGTGGMHAAPARPPVPSMQPATSRLAQSAGVTAQQQGYTDEQGYNSPHQQQPRQEQAAKPLYAAPTDGAYASPASGDKAPKIVTATPVNVQRASRQAPPQPPESEDDEEQYKEQYSEPQKDQYKEQYTEPQKEQYKEPYKEQVKQQVNGSGRRIGSPASVGKFT